MHVQSTDMDRAASRPTNNHFLRDPGQSFLAPPYVNLINIDIPIAVLSQPHQFIQLHPGIVGPDLAVAVHRLQAGQTRLHEHCHPSAVVSVTLSMVP